MGNQPVDTPEGDLPENHSDMNNSNANPSSSGDARAVDETSRQPGETATTTTPATSNGVRRRNNASTSAEGDAPVYVTRHRKALEQIRLDAVEARRHTIPHNGLPITNLDNSTTNSTSSNNDEGNAPPPVLASWTATSQKAWSKVSTRVQKDLAQTDWWATLLPMMVWLRTYDTRNFLPKDMIAGCTVAVMIVPQSMSYAKLAGLSVEFGLYSALVPVFAYALFGSSRQLAVGPVALISLLLSTGINNILDARGVDETDPNYTEIYSQLAIQISFLVGLGNIAMGVLRLGFVTIFLSHAVISGFTTGAAVIIGMSQIKHIFGYDVDRSDRFHEVLGNIIRGLDQINWRTFLMGSMAVAVMMFMKNVGKAYPRLRFARALGPLTVTAISIILTFAFNLEDKGIPIVARIPQGLPNVTIDKWLPIDNLDKVFVVTISIVIVGFMESIAIAKTLASKHKYEIDSSTELIGLGMANLLGSAFSGYPVTGSFSRSAVNNESGAVSGISAIITASFVGLVLLFLTPVFEQMPLSVLAAIVISGVLGLLDYPEAIHLWKVHKFDFAVWVIACTGTMFLGVETGLAIAVAVSLLIVIYESAYPHTSVLGRLPGTNVYRSVKQYPAAELYEGILMVRIEAPLYFANAQNVRDQIRHYRWKEENADKQIRYVILELAAVSHIDTSALHILQDMYETYRDRGQQICFSNPNVIVMQRFIDSGFCGSVVDRSFFFASVFDAVDWCLHEMDLHEINESGHGGGVTDIKDIMKDTVPAAIHTDHETDEMDLETPPQNIDHRD